MYSNLLKEGEERAGSNSTKRYEAEMGRCVCIYTSPGKQDRVEMERNVVKVNLNQAAADRQSHTKSLKLVPERTWFFFSKDGFQDQSLLFHHAPPHQTILFVFIAILKPSKQNK